MGKAESLIRIDIFGNRLVRINQSRLYLGMAMFRVHRVPILHNIILFYAYYIGMAMYGVHRVPILLYIIHFYAYYMEMTMYRVHRVPILLYIIHFYA